MNKDFFLKKFKDKKILVTGGFGFIGKSFIKKICNYSKSIFILDNLSNSYLDKKIIKLKNIKFFNFDIRNKKNLKIYQMLIMFIILALHLQLFFLTEIKMKVLILL